MVAGHEPSHVRPERHPGDTILQSDTFKTINDNVVFDQIVLTGMNNDAGHGGAGDDIARNHAITGEIIEVDAADRVLAAPPCQCCPLHQLHSHKCQ